MNKSPFELHPMPGADAAGQMPGMPDADQDKPQLVQRIPWPVYFMRIAYMVATRSTCLRRQVGCVLVKDKRILATGYNGAPAGVAHCLDVGCMRMKLGIPSGQRLDICRAIHAEQNVIVQAAVHGVAIYGADIYCTTHPCSQCSKMLINCGVKTIYYCDSYPDELSRSMLEEAGVRMERMEKPRLDLGFPAP